MGHSPNSTYRSTKHRSFILLVTGLVSCIPLLLLGCGQIVSQPSVIANNNSLPSDSPPRITYLDPQQQADGVLVKFTANTGNTSRARSLTAAGLTETGHFRILAGLRTTQVQPGLTINQTLEQLSQDPNVAYAEPNYLYRLDATLPNDSDFTLQYGLNNGNNADIDAPEAWDITIGDASVIVAVIDSGVDYNHPDLRNQIWTNPGEIPNNGIDDDRNGFIDDVRGWDFADNDNNPMDENQHGTHVAGIIGAQGNNNQGVVGVNWAIQIMPLKFMTAGGVGSTVAAIRSIEYAVANGAKISNNSWGGSAFSQALFDTIQAANQQGHLFIAASGNDGVNTDQGPHYPSTYNLPNIISVAATTPSDILAAFSNFGATTVDLAAPGLEIYSTVPNGGYRSLSGTSMAAPYVAGVGALLLAQNNTLTAAELKAALLDTVDIVPALAGRVLTGGRLNAFNAVKSIPVDAPTSPVEPLAITPPNSTPLLIGQAIPLIASGGDRNYLWQVDNELIASINRQTGVLTPSTAGNVNITVTDGTGLISSPLSLNILDPNNTLKMVPADLTTMNLSDTVTITVEGGVAPYDWIISDSRIATITTIGTIQQTATVAADQVGEFVISISDAIGLNISSLPIKVLTNALTLSGGKSTLAIGETTPLTVTGGTSPYQWTSSRNGVATVDAGGVVSAVSAGAVVISVADIIGISSSLTIDVISTASSGLTLSPNNAVISSGARVRLSITGSSTPVTWVSTDPTIADVDTRGVVVANTAGTVDITATDAANNTSSATIEVRNITIEAASFTIGAGDTLQMSAQSAVSPYEWSVSNDSIATINADGLLSTTRGIVGGVLVTVTDVDGISKRSIVTINNATDKRAAREQ